jgi:SAM-dependent methyltransferase
MLRFISDELAIERGIHGYHQNFLNAFMQYFDPAGKNILEIGGAFNPTVALEDIGARSWTSVQHPDFKYNEKREVLSEHSDRYTLIYKNFEDLNESDLTSNHYDAVFSMACFEHISRLIQTIRNAHRVLKPSAMLYSIFAPIWSGPHGHHFLRDQMLGVFSGRVVNVDFETPWDHLIYSRREFRQKYSQMYGEDLGTELTSLVYDNNHINRFHFEDYQDAFSVINFSYLNLRPLFVYDPPSPIQSQLNSRWSQHGYTNFSASGIEIMAIK